MSSDFIIAGSGIAGLFLAEKLSRIGTVTLVTKNNLANASTTFAQGGIAAVRDFDHDSVESHVSDTMKAGCDHNNFKAVEFLAKNANEALNELFEAGIVFDKKPTMEGGHSFPRIWHRDDFSGEYIEESLILKVQKNVNINIWDHAYVFDLVVKNGVCSGIWVEDHNQERHLLQANAIIFATGGAGYLFEKTTNPAVALGEGTAIAIKHGVKVEDLEFIQFHPTVLDIDCEPMFLLSEALRGEGAKLVDFEGKEFMLKYHDKQELAPRDIVSKAIYNEQKKGQIFLDMRHKSVDFLRQRFPNIVHELRKYDLKLERDLIPITPATHYTCGGIATDLRGQTNLPQFYAIGEAACTGVHGANRLASNSLIEAVVFAMSLYNELKKNKPKSLNKKIVQDIKIDLPISSKNFSVFLNKLRKIMWNYFGIVRKKAEMKNGYKKIKTLKVKDVRSKNVQTIALAIAEACLKRQESLGCHWVK